jgi:hypothetical protein
MKKTILILVLITFSTSFLIAQNKEEKYPEPEFTNEVTFLNKEKVVSVIRLEKASARLESKNKMGGFGGAESGYTLEGTRSTVRLVSGNNLSFVFSTGASVKSAPDKDSLSGDNLIDASAFQGMEGLSSMTDPSNTIALYMVEAAKGKRKILIIKSPGAMPFAGKKSQSANKLTFSVKKIREGYWELVVDKTLAKGEYAFMQAGMGMANIDGATLYAFGVD